MSKINPNKETTNNQTNKLKATPTNPADKRANTNTPKQPNKLKIIQHILQNKTHNTTIITPRQNQDTNQTRQPNTPKAAKTKSSTNASTPKPLLTTKTKTTTNTPPTQHSTKLLKHHKTSLKSPPKTTLTKRLKNSLFSVICKNR
jgi:hypothetical protein